MDSAQGKADLALLGSRKSTGAGGHNTTPLRFTTYIVVKSSLMYTVNVVILSISNNEDYAVPDGVSLPLHALTRCGGRSNPPDELEPGIPDGSRLTVQKR